MTGSVRKQQWCRLVRPERASATILAPSSGKLLKAAKVNLHQRGARGQLALHVSLQPYGFSGAGLREAAAALVVLTGRRPSRAVARRGRARLGVREGRVCGVYVNLRGSSREALRQHLQLGVLDTEAGRSRGRRALQRDEGGGWRWKIPRSSIGELDRWFQYFPHRSKGRLEVVYRPRVAGWPGRKGPVWTHQRVAGQGVRAPESSWLARGALGRPRQ